MTDEKEKVNEYDVRKYSFESIVSKIVDKYKDKTIEEIKVKVNEVCEAYVDAFGKKPDAYQLTLLADLILKEEIANPDPYKVQTEEFPFHSDAQRKRRKRKEFVTMDDTLDFMNHKRKTHASTAPPRDITTM